MSTIALSRAAGEKRQQAQAKLDELKAQVTKQATGEVADGETRLTAEEIAERKTEIQELIAEAAAIDGLDDLDKVASRKDGVSDEARKILQGGDGTAVPGDDTKERKGPFKNIGDFIRAVAANQDHGYAYDGMTQEKRQALTYLNKQSREFEKSNGDASMPLKELGDLDLKTLVGDDTGSSGRGDYLVPTEHMTELLRTMGEGQQFANRARRVPMSRRTADFPRLAQTTASDTRPMFSFAAVTKIAEGAQKPEREPTFEQLTLTAVKYAAYVEAGDELLSDNIIDGDLPPVLIELLTAAIAYEYDRDTMRGSGTAEPQGFIGHASAYEVNRQTTQNISTTDIFNMESRFFGQDGVYLFHPSEIPQLYGLAASNVIAWNRDLASSVPGVLMGRPLVRTVKLPVSNNEGSVCLVDPSYYLVGDLQRVTVASSIHYQFRHDVTAWRALFRAAGTPWPANTFSAEAAGGSKVWEQSPFVVLDIISS